MKTKEKIIQILEKEYPNLDFDNLEIEIIDRIFSTLEMEGVISYGVYQRETPDSAWLQAEYYSRKIGHTIIVDYDFDTQFNDIDDFCEAVEYTQEIVTSLESKLIKI